MMKAFVVCLAILAGPQDKLAPILERWRNGTEEERLQALRDAAGLRHETGDAVLAKFAEPPVRVRWERAGELMEIVSQEKIASWYGLLVPLLASGDPELRGRAVEELGRRELHALSGPVVPLLKDEESRVAWQAAFTLIQMDARDRVPEIAPLLKDPAASVRLNVHYVLCRLGSREHGPLLAPLLEDSDPAVAIAAVEALGDFQARDYAGRIVRFLEAPDPRQRKAAITALASMGAKDQSGKIAARLADGEVLVRWEAVRALGRLKARDRAGEIVAMADDDGALAPVLEAMGDLGLRELAPHILPHLDVADPGIRWRAVRALGRVDAKDDAKQIARMLKDEDSFVRLSALRALAATAAVEHAGEMIALLRDEEADVCQGAAEEAGALVSSEQLRSVVPLLGSDDPFVRFSALHLLVAADARDVLPSIIARLRSGDAVNGDVVWAIGRLGGRDQREKLLEVLRSDEVIVRQQAVFALARISERPEELEAFERASQGASKLAAGVALARLGQKDRAALAALLRAFVVRREEPEYQLFPGELFDAFLAGQEKKLTAALSKPVKAEKRIESIEDLRALLSKAGVTLAPDENLELRRRLPAGSTLTARRALEWSFGDDRCLIPDAAKVAVVDSARALAYWQKRLDAP